MKHFISTIALCLFIFLAIGSDEESSSSDSKGESCIPRDVTSHTLTGNTLTANVTVNYSINAEWCAKDVMGVAHKLAKKCYPDIDKLVLHYGIDYNTKYGEKKYTEVDTFEPDLNELRKYKSASLYKSGDVTTAYLIMSRFQRRGFN